MKTCVTGLVALAMLSCAPRSLERERGPLAQAFHDASEQTGVPVDLLMAVSHVETRWHTPLRDLSLPRQDRGQVGIMGLVDRPDQAWLEQGAAVAGLGSEQVRREARANILAAAQVLAQLQREQVDAAPMRSSERTRAALARYGADDDPEAGPAYAAQVLELLQRGVFGEGDGGELLSLRGRGKLGAGSSTSQPLTVDHPGAHWVPALFYTAGRGAAVDRVIIHTAEGSYQGCISWFRNASNPYQTSSHYVVRSSDGDVTQMVRESDSAHHIGDWNPRSVGIEHEAIASQGNLWFTEAMYRSSAALTRGICQRHGIPMDRQHIMGHIEVPGATHVDPGPHWDWDYFMSLVLDPNTQPMPPAQSSCGGIDYAGECVGQTLRWCENNSLRQVDCAASGRSCGYQDASVGFNCLASSSPPPSSGCGNETYHGRCEGQTLVWCEGGAVRRHDCAGDGRVCALESSSVGYNCVAAPSPPPTSGCGGETYYGRCEGQTLVWCEGGAIKRHDCAASGRACALENSDIGYNCVAAPSPPPASGCGGETYYGRCEGQTLVWCEGGAVRRHDCAGDGRVCALESSSVGYNCVAASTGGCGSETYYGRCEGQTLVWCEGGAVQRYNCSAVGMSCGLQDSVTGNNCL